MFLGLDLGTTGLKALVIDDAQNVVASANAPLEVSRPESGWSEQDPDGWVLAAQTALALLAKETDLSLVQGIGLSGQMHGATLLGADDRPIRPCILWNDTRASVEAAQLDADPNFRAINGNIVFPGFTAPKVSWVETHEPEIFARVARVLLPKDYLRLWLTGEAVSDMSDAAGTSWFDTGARDWSDTLLETCGLNRSAMPRLVEGSEVSGILRVGAAKALGLPEGIPVAGGAGDNAASAIGMGVADAGQAFVSLGTSGVLFAANDSYTPAPDTAVHTFCHALPGKWHQMGVILSATDALNWYARFVGRDAADLTGDLGSLEAPGRTLFLPYLGGERTPLNNAAIRGAFLGLEHTTDQAGGTRAILDGVAFAMRDCLDALEATGTRIERVTAVGGGSRSEVWLEALATAFDLPVDVPAGSDLGAAFGAARLGFMAAMGQGGEVATPPKIEKTILPNAMLADAYSEAHTRYVAARQAVSNTAI